MNSMKKNKSHQVDDLFRHGLADFKIEPSAETNEKFLVAINKTKKGTVRPMWYFSAAASIVFLCGLSWFFINHEADTKPSLSSVTNTNIEPIDAVREEPTIAETNKVIRQTPVSEDIKPAAKLVVDNSVKPALESNLDNKTEETPSHSVTVPQTNKQVVSEPQRSLTGILETDELVQDRLTLAFEDAEKRKQNENKAVAEKPSTLFQKSVGETIIIVTADIENTEEDIYIPEVNSDSPISLAEAKDIGLARIEEERSLFAKVFTELKHFKHGEKVNLNTLTASNDIPLIEDEDSFIGHETMQIRERFKWIKGKISKQ